MDELGVWRVAARDLDHGSAAAAAAIAGAGAGRGDRIVLSVPSSPAALAAIVGALRAGVVPVVLNPTLTAAERDPLVADADPALVVVGDGALRDLLAAGPAAASSVPDLSPVPLGRPMHYTSGTSGRPKGVWAGVLDEAEATAMYDDEADTWGIDASDVLLLCSPLHHSAPVRFAIAAWLRGADVVLVAPFDAAAVADAVEQHRPTVAFLVPSHLQRLFALEDDAGRRQRLALESFRVVAHAGERCPAELKRRAIDAFPDGAVWEFYGSTEGQFTVCSSSEWLERPGTVGRARQGRAVSVDGDGQVWCTAPAWARFTYWRDADKTAAAWRDGAFTAGDIGRLDDDGFLYLDGRRDDLVISGGVNVYPAEVEAVLTGVAGVREVVVFGVPDERWGQRVCAAVIGDATVAALQAEAEARLAPYKRPKQYVMVDDLPRTSTGKVRRSTIAEALGLGRG
jgi:long-chain acyl-CoA synthetase